MEISPRWHRTLNDFSRSLAEVDKVARPVLIFSLANQSVVSKPCRRGFLAGGLKVRARQQIKKRFSQNAECELKEQSRTAYLAFHPL